MKTIPVALQNHYDTKQTTIAHAIKITRPDGQIFAYHSHDEDKEVGGVVYTSANGGFSPSDILTGANLAVGNLELKTLNDGTVFTAADLLTRAWDNSTFEIFRYNWNNTADGIEEILAGSFGEVTLRLNEVVVELRDIRAMMNMNIGALSSKTCRARLGSTGYGHCNLDISSMIVTTTVTSVTSRQILRDNTRTEDADWFGDGEIEFLDGDNAGLRRKIRVYDVNGTITMMLPAYRDIMVGDSIKLTPGCRKRWDVDCRDKFNNLLNFQGEPHRPGANKSVAL